MVKPAFSDIDVDLWVHEEILGVTKPTICVFHDDRAKGAQILEALSELAGETPPSQRIITFRTCARDGALRSLRLKYEEASDALQVMHIRHDRDTATVAFSNEGRSILNTAVTTWLGGADDFGVSPRHCTRSPKNFGPLDRESGELWFWGPTYTGP